MILLEWLTEIYGPLGVPFELRRDVIRLQKSCGLKLIFADVVAVGNVLGCGRVQAEVYISLIQTWAKRDESND